VALACAILLGSSVVRSRQALRIEGELEEGRRRPRIDLTAVPLELGPWKGQDTEIDPHIARATGADQVVTRRYVNQDTGSTLELILLYGPAANVYIHAPELCYPTAGFAQVGGPDMRPIPVGTAQAPFRSLVYAKGEGSQADLQEVYYSWRYQGRWTPDVGKQKHFERIPSMYKVHVARRVTAAEKRDVGNPCEAFLRALLPDLERRIQAPQSPPS
jgi:EpsI family protein